MNITHSQERYHKKCDYIKQNEIHCMYRNVLKKKNRAKFINSFIHLSVHDSRIDFTLWGWVHVTWRLYIDASEMIWVKNNISIMLTLFSNIDDDEHERLKYSSWLNKKNFFLFFTKLISITLKCRSWTQFNWKSSKSLIQSVCKCLKDNRRMFLYEWRKRN